MYITLAEYSIDDIIPYIGSRKQFSCNDKVYSVKLTSARLQLFRQSLICVGCQLIGSVFRLQLAEKDIRTIVPHINLYGSKDNRWILFTKDHIIPKSKGGKNILSNYQTMCYECNFTKGNMYEI